MTTPTFEHAIAGLIALLAAVAAIVVTKFRRPAVPRFTLALCAGGLLLLALAAAGFTIRPAVSQSVAVMVDLSASTRGATYRDPVALNHRVQELLGNVPYEIRSFGETSHVPTPPPQADAPAMILFSDGRFSETPLSLPPLYAVIDPALESPPDAAVTSLEPSTNPVPISIRNTASVPRSLSLNGLKALPMFARELDGRNEMSVLAIPSGSFTLAATIKQDSPEVSAVFAPGDLWPENDAMRAAIPPPPTARRLWIGKDAAPGAGWKTLQPAELPREPAALLGTSLIVLDNISAAALDHAQQAALANYVRDLGGGLVILGGASAFSAGGYTGTTLDQLSPLASTPPEPMTHWILLADASGSMNQDAGGKTRWQFASNAIVSAIAMLPPDDLLSIGSFADDVRWWSRGKSVRDTQTMRLPPEDAQPRGRTNLESALRELAQSAPEKLPAHVLIATDAQTTINGAAELAARLESEHIKLHVLLIGPQADATALTTLRQIVSTTGGAIRIEQLPQNWAAGLRELLQATEASNLHRDPVKVQFLGKLASLGTITTTLWNQTWTKSQATPLAQTITPTGQQLVMAGHWNLGEGAVTAATFFPSEQVIDALAKETERPPRDPRFRMSWQTGSMIRVAIDGIDNGRFLNGQPLSLQLAGEPAVPIPQIAPGRYAIVMDSPRKPALATVRRGQQILDLRTIAEHYPPEFDAIGNDRDTLSALAQQTGGAVIEPGDTRRLDIRWPRRSVSLGSPLAIAGAMLILSGLIRWRLGS